MHHRVTMLFTDYLLLFTASHRDTTLVTVLFFLFFPTLFLLLQFHFIEMEENHEKTYESDSVLTEFSENPLNNETPNEGNTYSSEEAFILAIKAYAKQNGFQVRLGKSEKNAMGQIRKRTIVCSREGFPDKSSNKRNRASQRCNCQFKVVLLLTLIMGFGT